jgi:hypothetical protein
VLVVAVAALLAYGPIAQPPHYHEFADRRAFLGIPNAADVLSNLAFAAVALWGWWSLRDRPRTPGLVLFIAALLFTTAGSAYYHWAPDNGRLFWDRLPIALGAAGLLACFYARTHATRQETGITWALAVVGVASVLFWSFTDRAGAGDLRPYLLLQLSPIVLVPLWQAIARSPRRERLLFALAAGLYVAAKIAEAADRPIFEALGFMSGHTLKHLLAAIAGVVLLLAVKSRA